MEKCKYYKGNNYCNLHKQYVASAYCGDICENGPKILDDLKIKNDINKDADNQK